MKVVLQRVSKAAVSIDNLVHNSICNGLMILVGICPDDTEEDINWLSQKISALRIFSDAQQKMNLSIQDINGEILLISQFTLYAETKKGNRPSFTSSAPPTIALPIYHKFTEALQAKIGKNKVKTGIFGADMQVELINDGPVTIIIDSKNKE